MVTELAFDHRSGCGYCRHDRCKGNKHVVEVATVIDRLSFVSKLQATTAHAKVHRIHVDKSWVRLVLCLRVRKFVDK